MASKNPLPRPLLAGVCSGIAARLRWNVWCLRTALLVLLLVKPLVALVGYVIAAAVFGLLQNRRAHRRGGGTTRSPRLLHAPELAARDRRIERLDRRLKELE